MKENTMDAQQALFCADFETKTGEKAVSLELVSLEASAENLKKLKLQYPAGQFCLWGLLVLCESKAVFFFSHAQDFTIMGFKPTNSDSLATKEQVVRLSDTPQALSLSRPVYKTWLSRVFAPNNVLLGETAEGAVFTLKTMKKASQVLEQLSSFITAQ